jgi:phosphatidylserine/phosphatidylglycerophosphate/cardiolipin synthase-like enzyme
MSIRVTFLEEGKQRPEKIAELLASFLGAAQKSLHIAIYDFHLSAPVAEPILRALRERAAAGVDVRIVYDAGKPTELYPAAGVIPPSPATATFIRGIGNEITSKAITGGRRRVLKLMHHKYIVRDGEMPTASLWTGSMNWTEESWSLQENNILCIDSADICAYYETDFEELWSQGDIGSSGIHDRGTANVNGARVTVAFAPGDGPTIDHDIALRIGAARRRIKVCSVIITSGGILGALADSRHQGQVAHYGGIYDRTQMESVFRQWKGTPREWKIGAFQQVAAGLAAKLSTPYTPTSVHDFMHNKLLVLDDTVITGSYNFSHSATENAENVLMIEDPGLADRYDAYIAGLVRRYGRVTN